jgi:hypothetical protein
MKKLTEDDKKEFIAVNMLNTITGWIVYPLLEEDEECRDKLIDSANFVAGTMTNNWVKEAIEKGDLEVKERSSVYGILQTISKNDLGDYSTYYKYTTVKEIQNLIYSGENLNNFKRVAIMLMFFLKYPDRAGFNYFDDNIFKQDYKNDPYLKNLGCDKIYKESYKKYKRVSHFILVQAVLNFEQIFIKSMPPESYDSNDDNTPSCYNVLMFFYEFAEYFKQRLLKLNNKHNSRNKQKLFKEDDFIDLNNELELSDYLYSIKKKPNLDRSPIFDSMFNYVYSELEKIVPILVPKLS